MTIRIIALTGGTLLFGLVHFPVAKFTWDASSSIPENRYSGFFTVPLMPATSSGQAFWNATFLERSFVHGLLAWRLRSRKGCYVVHLWVVILSHRSRRIRFIWNCFRHWLQQLIAGGTLKFQTSKSKLRDGFVSNLKKFTLEAIVQVAQFLGTKSLDTNRFFSLRFVSCIH